MDIQPKYLIVSHNDDKYGISDWIVGEVDRSGFELSKGTVKMLTQPTLEEFSDFIKGESHVQSLLDSFYFGFLRQDFGVEELAVKYAKFSLLENSDTTKDKAIAVGLFSDVRMQDIETQINFVYNIVLLIEASVQKIIQKEFDYV